MHDVCEFFHEERCTMSINLVMETVHNVDEFAGEKRCTIFINLTVVNVSSTAHRVRNLRSFENPF